jgi:hypothetical protein
MPVSTVFFHVRGPRFSGYPEKENQDTLKNIWLTLVGWFVSVDRIGFGFKPRGRRRLVKKSTARWGNQPSRQWTDALGLGDNIMHQNNGAEVQSWLWHCRQTALWLVGWLQAYITKAEVVYRLVSVGYLISVWWVGIGRDLWCVLVKWWRLSDWQWGVLVGSEWASSPPAAVRRYVCKCRNMRWRRSDIETSSNYTTMRILTIAVRNDNDPSGV